MAVTKTFNLGKVKGPSGDPGINGEPGLPGEPGKRAVIKIGTVETATDGQEPNVYIEETDDEENSYTLGFVLPQGKGGISSFVSIVPTQSGELKYTGEKLVPKWDNYDPNVLEISGETTGTDVKTYNVTFTPKPGSYWNDLSNTGRPSTWSIVKGDQTISAETTSIDLTLEEPTGSFVITGAKTQPTVTVDNNKAIYTEQYQDDTLTINVTGQKNGTTTFTIECPADNNWNKSNKITVTANVTGLSAIYGVEWDGTSKTTWKRTDNAAGFSDPVVYDDTGECKNGSTTTYGSPFDEIYPWSGMTATTDETLGTLVRIPYFYYKLEQTNGNGIKIQISEKYEDGFSISPAHMNRGDGKTRDMIYIGRYHSANSTYKSTTGATPQNNITRDTARTKISALHSTAWQLDWATWFTLWLLYLVEFADWNSQSCIGKGNDTYPRTTGSTDKMPYHTGQTSKGSYKEFQYRNIEAPWGNVLDWLDGCYNSSAGFNVILNPSKFSDTTGGISIGTPSNGYPSKFEVKNVSGTFPSFIATEASGSATTYSCDSWFFGTGYPCVCVGGYTTNASYGLFCRYYYSVSYTGSNVGCRLQKLP